MESKMQDLIEGGIQQQAESSEQYDLLRRIGFNDREAFLAILFAERQEMTVEQLLRTALRYYQVHQEPRPELPVMGCMGD